MTQPDRPFVDEPTEVLRTALGLANRHAEQAARFNPVLDGPLPAVVRLFRDELQHRGEGGDGPTAPAVPAGQAPATDDTDLTEADVDRMMAAGTPVQIVTGPPATYGATPATDQTALRERIAALFRHPPGAERLGDATPGEIADAVLAVLPASVDRAAALEEAADIAEDVAMRLHKEHDVGGATGAYEVMTELRHLATAAASAVVVRRATDETPGEAEPTESVIYEVVGDWGVDSADSAEGARAAVAKWLRAYPKCGAFAQQRIVREWPDGSEFYGPWTDIPADEPAVGAQQPKEAHACPGFPETCPTLRAALPDPGGYTLAVRCGCYDKPKEA